MVLTNSGGLFSNTGLLQDDGIISQRWGQQGNIIYNFYVDTSSDNTVHTVTANKVLYISSIWVNYGGATGAVFLRDGGAAGDIRFIANATAQTVDTSDLVVFDPPLKFETALFCDEVGTNTGDMTITGWEE